MRINNNAGAMVISFEEIWTGSPATASTPIVGCMNGGTCDTLETSTSTSNSIHSPTISKVYDYFLITPSWTGGTNPTFTVNVTLTTAQSQSGGGGGGGAVSSVFGRSGAVTAQSGDYSYSQISSTPQLAQTITSLTHEWLNSYSAVTGLFTQAQPACGDLSNSAASCGTDTTNASNIVSGTLGVPEGGTGVGSLTAHALPIGEGASAPNFLQSPNTNGNCVVRFNVTASAAVDPTCAVPGVSVNAQSGSYSLLYSDRAAYLKFSGGTTATITLCQITGTCANNYTFVVQNLNSGNLTITANAADSIDAGSTGGSITILPNQAAFIYQDASSAPGNWWSVRFPNTSGFQSPLMSGSANGTTAATTTAFIPLNNSSTTNTTEAVRDTAIPASGTMSNLCVTTTSTQSAGGAYTITLRDSTAASDTALTVSFPASQTATTLCDNTHVVSVTATHLYVWKVVNAGSGASAIAEGISALYTF